MPVFLSISDLPPRETEPFGNASWYLRLAFNALKLENQDRHWHVVHADAVAKHLLKARQGKRGDINILLEAIQREREDLEAAERLCSKALWDALKASPRRIPPKDQPHKLCARSSKRRRA